MTRIRNRSTDVRQLAGAACWSLLLSCGLVGPAWAVSPLKPLPKPYYSFDLASVKVPAVVDADAVLVLDDGTEDPRIVIPGGNLGMGQEGDELDALSIGVPMLEPTDSFSFLFSVDRDTVGAVEPDPALVLLYVPYNVTHQALRGQAAGDQYMSTTLFTLAGGPVTPLPPRTSDNNTLVRNNYDEGGTDSGAHPLVSAEEDATGLPQDELDGTSAPPPSPLAAVILDVYFSAKAGSPSLVALGGADGASGAHIFYNPDPSTPGNTVMYATALNLGLSQADDIDAMIVYDVGTVGEFDSADWVLFSLAPGSSSGGPAQIFLGTHDAAPKPFASATNLGLDLASDNVDALDYLPCDDAELCATRHGIRKGAVPAVSEWGMVVMVVLLIVGGGLVFSRVKRRVA